jgi:hypothetical protein
VRLVAFGLVIAVTQFVGCASIVNGQNESVSVEARGDSGPVAGATCSLSNDKGKWFVTTPGSTTVHRSANDMEVRCEKSPLDPGVAMVKSNVKGMAFGNILFGGFIGAGVDMATGAAYDYPTLISVVMGTTTAVAAPPGSGAKPVSPQDSTISTQSRAKEVTRASPASPSPTASAPRT